MRRLFGVAENYNSRVFIGSIEDGNGIEVTARIQDGIIEDVRFRSFGCKSLLASAVRLVSDIRECRYQKQRLLFRIHEYKAKGFSVVALSTKISYCLGCFRMKLTSYRQEG